MLNIKVHDITMRKNKYDLLERGSQEKASSF